MTSKLPTSIWSAFIAAELAGEVHIKLQVREVLATLPAWQQAVADGVDEEELLLATLRQWLRLENGTMIRLARMLGFGWLPLQPLPPEPPPLCE